MYIGVAIVAALILWSVLSKPKYEVKGIGFDDASAKVTIIEYGDYQCPACGVAYPILKEVEGIYSREQLKIVFKNFPLTQIHPYALKASQAAECSRDQDKFEAYHDKLYENQKALDIASLKKYAADLGLDTKAFNACLDSGAMQSRVLGDLDEGVRKGVNATPSFFINGKKYEGVLQVDELKEIIDAALK